MAISTTGSYISFSSNKNYTASEFTSTFDKLDTQILDKVTGNN